MLGKLLKHEFRATGRYILPIYGVVIIVTLLNRGLLLLSDVERFQGNPILKIAGASITVMSVLLLIAMIFGTIFLVVQRFYKHLYSSEGYLSFTLPVKPVQHLNAKLISACVWVALSGCMVLVYFFGMVLHPNLGSAFRQIFTVIKNFFTDMPPYGALIMIELLLFLIFTVVQSILQFYASISLGQRMMPEKRILGAILAYFCIQFAMQVLLFVLLSGAAMIGSTSIDSIMKFFDDTNEMQIVQLMLLFGVGYSVVLSAVFYYINYNTMNRHLNLE